jgi:deoxyhypusine synthase
LFEQGYNRIYDTLEMESNLNDVERLVRATLNDVTPPDGVWSSARLCREIGRKLDEGDMGVGILRSAFQQDVPVFIPAFTDSEVGLDVATWAMRKWVEANKLDPQQLTADELLRVPPPFNPFLDMLEYARLVGSAETLGIFTIGGGVPRNWAQQVAPFYDITTTAGSNATAAVQVRGADLPGAGPLGRAERVHVLRRRELGEVRLAARGGAVRGGVCRRDGGVAVVDEGGV